MLVESDISGRSMYNILYSQSFVVGIYLYIVKLSVDLHALHLFESHFNQMVNA